MAKQLLIAGDLSLREIAARVGFFEVGAETADLRPRVVPPQRLVSPGTAGRRVGGVVLACHHDLAPYFLPRD